MHTISRRKLADNRKGAKQSFGDGKYFGCGRLHSSSEMASCGASSGSSRGGIPKIILKSCLNST
jgi:hypothetical protein